MSTKLIMHTLRGLMAKEVTQQGIVGIQLPEWVRIEYYSNVISALMELQKDVDYEIQIVLLPPPKSEFRNQDHSVLADRVFRDRNDAIRYNRLYLALYWDNWNDIVKSKHDIYIDVSGNNENVEQVIYQDNRHLFK